MMKMQYQFLQMWRLVQLWEGHGYKRLRLGHVPLLSLVMVNLPLYIIFVQAKPCRWGHRPLPVPQISYEARYLEREGTQLVASHVDLVTMEVLPFLISWMPIGTRSTPRI